MSDHSNGISHMYYKLFKAFKLVCKVPACHRHSCSVFIWRTDGASKPRGYISYPALHFNHPHFFLANLQFHLAPPSIYLFRGSLVH